MPRQGRLLTRRRGGPADAPAEVLQADADRAQQRNSGLRTKCLLFPTSGRPAARREGVYAGRNLAFLIILGRPSAPSSGRPVVVEPQWPARNGLYAAGSQLLGARAAVSAQAAPRQAGAALGRGSPRSGEGSARKRANCAGTLCDLRQHGSRGKPRDGAGWRRSRARMPRRGPAAGAGGMCAFRTWNAREARRGAGSQMGGLEGPPRDLRDRRASGPDPRSHAICGCSAQQGFAVGR